MWVGDLIMQTLSHGTCACKDNITKTAVPDDKCHTAGLFQSIKEGQFRKGRIFCREFLNHVSIKRGRQPAFGEFDAQIGAVLPVQAGKGIRPYPKQPHRQVDIDLADSQGFVKCLQELGIFQGVLL
jgi:hypothetical protein